MPSRAPLCIVSGLRAAQPPPELSVAPPSFLHRSNCSSISATSRRPFVPKFFAKRRAAKAIWGIDQIRIISSTEGFGCAALDGGSSFLPVAPSGIGLRERGVGGIDASKVRDSALTKCFLNHFSL